MKQQHFTIIITAYNAQKWIWKCISSAITQDYENFDIVCIDAGSSDDTYFTMMDFQTRTTMPGNFTVIQNYPRRCYRVENIYKAVKQAKPGTICVSLDGDDSLAGSDVLHTLNEIYIPDVWLTYGRYRHKDHSPIPAGTHHRYPDEIIAGNTYRQYPKQLYTHLRTWRRELFLKIREEDLKIDGKFASNAGDCFFGYPLVEMAGQRQAFINKILYVYNTDNPLSDGIVAPEEQVRLADYAKGLTPYKPLANL
jgi:glycosyltransferase involved in cell wall biosynthesis